MTYRQNIQNLKKNFWKRFSPPPDLKISEWADTYRYLSSESSAEPGKFDISRTPYMREIVDTVCDPNVQETWVKKSAQIAYSENGNNILGYYIHQDPCPMMMLQPTLDMANAYSKDRISPMFRDAPVLADLIDDRSRVSGNTILHKKFSGGHLTMAGANSPASLASRPVRGVFVDEPDRYPPSAGDEGDPIKLIQKRQITFWNRWFFAGGTPTIKGLSRIEKGYQEGDKRLYFVPCPHCKNHITLEPKKQCREPEDPNYAKFKCPECEKYIDESHKTEMLKDKANGGTAHWKATAPFAGKASFYIWAAYSPWMSWQEIADEYNLTKSDAQQYKTYVNTVEGDVYEETGEKPEIEKLMARRIDYHPHGIPDEIAVITAGIDSQGDRLEIEVIGWGRGEESWSLDYKQITGDPLRQKVWNDLDQYLQASTFTRIDGLQLKIKAACIDSGGKSSRADGHVSDRVYKYVRGKQHRNIYACKGSSNYGQPVIARVSKLKKQKIKLVLVGTDTAKDIIYSRLEIEGAGEGACHFPLNYKQNYFEMLTAEEKITEYINGNPQIRWKLGKDSEGKKQKRNEALDTRVYAMAALRMLPINLSALAKRNATRARKEKELNPENNTKQPTKKQEQPKVIKSPKTIIKKKLSSPVAKKTKTYTRKPKTTWRAGL